MAVAVPKWKKYETTEELFKDALPDALLITYVSSDPELEDKD